MSKPTKVIRLSPQIARQLRLTAREAGVPVEEVLRIALVEFAQADTETQRLILWRYVAPTEEIKVPEAPVRHGLLARLGRVARACLGRGGDSSSEKAA